MLDFLINFESHYIQNWEIHSGDVKDPGSTTEAKQQIDELYKYLRKVQEESSSPVKKMVLKKVRTSLETKVYPDSIKEIIMEELQKFEDLNEMYPEFQTIKDFLELVSELPYGVTSDDNFDINHAREILDKDHFGMEKVKNRILEFIAVAKLKNKIKGKRKNLIEFSREKYSFSWSTRSWKNLNSEFNSRMPQQRIHKNFPRRRNRRRSFKRPQKNLHWRLSWKTCPSSKKRSN